MMRPLFLAALSCIVSLSACSNHTGTPSHAGHDSHAQSEDCVFENHNIDIAALKQTKEFGSLSWLQADQVLGGVLPGSAVVRIFLFQCSHHGADVQLLINPLKPEESVQYSFSAFEHFFQEKTSQTNLKAWLKQVDLAKIEDGVFMENALEQTGYDEVFLQYTDVNGLPILVFGFRGF